MYAHLKVGIPFGKKIQAAYFHVDVNYQPVSFSIHIKFFLSLIYIMRVLILVFASK